MPYSDGFRSRMVQRMLDPDPGKYGWYGANAKGGAHEVATRRANAWGLYDLHGNVWEWVEDTYHRSYEDAPADGSPWTAGGWPEGCPYRVYRGGGWLGRAGICRSARRFGIPPVGSVVGMGFRPAF